MAHQHAILITATSKAPFATQVLRDYLKLAKYRLSGLVAFTAGVGYCLRAEETREQSASDLPFRRGDVRVDTRTASFSEQTTDWSSTFTNFFPTSAQFYREAVATTLGTFLTAAAANTLNQLYEIRSDAQMGRTRLRPLPAGRLSIPHAATFAVVTAASGLAILLHETNSTATALAAANLTLYAGVYTPLKAVSSLNTWIGAVVGAIPPMLGWAAASDGRLLGERERGVWAVGALLFLWQIPHFNALAVISKSDYAAAGLRMLAVTNPQANAFWARVTAAAMIPVGITLTSTGTTSELFAWEATALSVWMCQGAARLGLAPSSAAAARPLFKASISYLPIVMTLMLAHKLSPEERQQRDAYRNLIQNQQAGLDQVRLPRRTVIYHPWEALAPFPFLPMPLYVPIVVLNNDTKEQ